MWVNGLRNADSRLLFFGWPLATGTPSPEAKQGWNQSQKKDWNKIFCALIDRRWRLKLNEGNISHGQLHKIVLPFFYFVCSWVKKFEVFTFIFKITFYYRSKFIDFLMFIIFTQIIHFFHFQHRGSPCPNLIASSVHFLVSFITMDNLWPETPVLSLFFPSFWRDFARWGFFNSIPSRMRSIYSLPRGLLPKWSARWFTIFGPSPTAPTSPVGPSLNPGRFRFVKKKDSDDESDSSESF